MRLGTCRCDALCAPAAACPFWHAGAAQYACSAAFNAHTPHLPYPFQERAYIEATAKADFRRHRGAAPAEAAAKLAEAEQQLEVSLHYGIAYPRLHHSAAQFRGRRYMAPHQMPAAVGGGRRGGRCALGAGAGGGGCKQQ